MSRLAQTRKSFFRNPLRLAQTLLFRAMFFLLLAADRGVEAVYPHHENLNLLAAAKAKLHRSREVAEVWGLPKLVWVILADVVAMMLFIVAIPVVLNCAKRRRPLFR
eukprot:CAMPEP_0178997166 /NCGR_PEP_ID=MMETSP0795-20121207/8776_1 /TAXON_ID=88552 /ORGANISM="Amoebophrya sp., Strain Ameob2" /LENGTH=106 /DNA_ID=CAMNT_0020689643 /DNA_START=63 /DNA_END=383 /DNA_ORIENTATION=+